MDDPSKYASVMTAIDPETTDVKWQVRIDGNLDVIDTDKDGRWAVASAYNDEEGVEIEGMTRNDRDYMKAFYVPGSALTAVVLANPVDVFRVLVLDAVGATGSGFAAVYADVGIPLSLLAAALIAWCLGPVLLAARAIRTRSI